MSASAKQFWTSATICVLDTFVSLTLNPAVPSLSERFVLIILGMCQAAARRGAKDWASSELILVLWGRLQRMARRFESLVAVARAGRLPGKPLSPRTRPRRLPTPNRPDLPRGFAWLLRLVPDTAAYGSQLQYLLTDPEITALLKAAPQTGRILRPLCRMLGVAPGPATLPRSPTTPDRSPPRTLRAEPPVPVKPLPDTASPPHEPTHPDRSGNRVEPTSA